MWIQFLTLTIFIVLTGEKGICCNWCVRGVEVCGGRVRSVGVVKVCGTMLEMGQ